MPFSLRQEPEPSPLGALGRGLLAGFAGTGVVTAVVTARQLLTGGEATVESKAEHWDEAPPPAEVGRRVVEDVFDRTVPQERSGLLMQAVHWLYGTSAGGVYGLVQGTVRGDPVAHGSVFGACVWLASHAALVPGARLEPPVWKQPPLEIGFGIVSHVVYGVTVALAYDALEEQL